MVEQLPQYPDAEVVVMALLESLAPTVTSTPDTLTGPLIRVQRIGGADDGITDRPRIEVACYAPTRTAAHTLQQQCQQLILAARCTVVAGCLIDRTTTDTGPIQPPRYPNQDVRWVPAIYRMEWRRPPA